MSGHKKTAHKRIDFTSSYEKKDERRIRVNGTNQKSGSAYNYSELSKNT